MMEKRLPAHFRMRTKTSFAEHVSLLQKTDICTVCKEARCPNQAICYEKKRATFLLLGPECTRKCAFCAISHSKTPKAPSFQEIERLSAYCKEARLSSVVLTMVTRDDLEDGGAFYMASAVTFLKKEIPSLQIELLVSDFQGKYSSIRSIVDAKCDIFGHNIESVYSISKRIRDRASYERSIDLLAYVHEYAPKMVTKSGFMVGFGEHFSEVEQTLSDLRRAGVLIVTIGQYLQPTEKQIPVSEYISMETFERYKELGIFLGFQKVISGPFVRSSLEG